MSQEEIHDLIIYQKSYFDILTEFFVNVTGCLPRDFSSVDDFSDSLHRLAEELKLDSKRQSNALNAFSDLEDKLKSLYSAEAINVFRSAKNLDACKLNLGGSSRFLKTHLSATRKSLLFSDMVLIPDPIMPWIEKNREEEKFTHVIPLQMTFFVLHLSGLIGSEFDIPPFFVFPSFEKTLEDNDTQTQEGTLRLITDVFSNYVDTGIESLDDIVEFGTKHPEMYFKKIEESQLFVSPGGDPGESLKTAIENYKEEVQQWRTDEWCKKMFSLGDISVVTNAIFERISPNFHLLENSDELRSHPFLCIDAQAHYYKLIANMKNKTVVTKASIDPSTTAIIKSLTSTKLDYLANISDEQIVNLRKTNENIEFRRELRELVKSLPEAKIDDLGYVASEVCSHIELLITKHIKQVEVFNDKYNAKHKYTALIGAGTLGVTMFPVLAPFLGALLPLGLASVTGKYTSDKLEEKAEGKNFSHSMMGVLSLAKNK